MADVKSSDQILVIKLRSEFIKGASINKLLHIMYDMIDSEDYFRFMAIFSDAFQTGIGSCRHIGPMHPDIASVTSSQRNSIEADLIHEILTNLMRWCDVETVEWLEHFQLRLSDVQRSQPRLIAYLYNRAILQHLESKNCV